MLAVEARNVTKTYRNGVHALRGIDLEIRRGELFCLLGPNGAGKTTLMRILGTRLRLSAGEVKILGHDLTRQVTEIRKHIAALPQEARPFPTIKVWEHIYYYLGVRGQNRGEARRRTEDILARLGLTEKRDHTVAQLSGGMRHRVLLGMVLAAASEILLLDEPTTGLDVLLRRQTWDLLNLLKKRTQTTILLTTHSMEEAAALADRVGIVSQGKLVAIGTLPELFQLAPGRWKVVIDKETMPRDRLGEFGTTQSYAGKWAVFFKDIDAAQRFLRFTAERELEAALLRTTLEDIFVYLVGDEAELRLGDLR